jgi:hypothetical protein
VCDPASLLELVVRVVLSDNRVADGVIPADEPVAAVDSFLAFVLGCHAAIMPRLASGVQRTAWTEFRNDLTRRR